MNTITTTDCVSERSIILMSILGDMRLVVTSTEGKGPTSLLTDTRQNGKFKVKYSFHPTHADSLLNCYYYYYYYKYLRASR